MLIKPSTVKVSCPSRIDFTGGFTDVMPFRATQWVDHINLAIDLPVEVILRPRNDSLIVVKNKSTHTTVTFASVDEIEERFSLIKAALINTGVTSDITIIIDSHAPAGAGLGTSGALSVALITALTLFTGRTLSNDKSELATAAAEVEQASGTLGGLQDQFAAATGGLNLFQFYGSKYSSKRINLSDQHIKELEQRVLILYPGGNRRSTDIVASVMKEYRNANSAVSSALSSLNKLAPKILEALKSTQWEKLSSLLQDVREQQLVLHPDLIDDGNRKIIYGLNKRGVEGIKLLGGGGSGACLLVISTSDASRKVIESICELHNIDIIPVQYERKGVQAKVNDLMPAI